jgi:hypothetical protein
MEVVQVWLEGPEEDDQSRIKEDERFRLRIKREQEERIS